MGNNQRRKRFSIKFIYEILLCTYIIIVPIINSLSEILFGGYGIHIWIICSLLLMTVVINIFTHQSNKNKIGFPIVIFFVFLIEIIIQLMGGEALEVGVVVSVFLYIAFLKIPNHISVKRVYQAVFVSAIIAAIYSITQGIVLGTVIRTATMVDGSISIITILIVFWGREAFNKTVGYNLLKYSAMFSSFVVALFGMSRSRLVILATLVLVKMFLALKNIIKSKKINTISLLSFPVILFAVAWLLRLDVLQNLFEAVFTRFDVAFESLGREDEMRVGWQFFLNNPLFGCGWGKIRFNDYQNYLSNYDNHCMYIAILARGGLFIGMTFFLSFVSLVKNVLKQKRETRFFCLITLLIFFALGYGNAGIFNYTVCSMLIPLILNLNCVNNIRVKE